MAQKKEGNESIFESFRAEKVKRIFKYELSRILRRKAFFIFFGLALVAQIITILHGRGISDMSTTWVMSTAIVSGAVGMGAGLLAIAAAFDSVAEEFENGHIKTLFTKPLGKLEFYVGKYLACAFLVISALLLLMGVGASGYLMFESQGLAANLPLVFGAIVYSSLIYLSIAFAVGTITKKSSATVIVGLFLIFGLPEIEILLSGTGFEWMLKVMPSVTKGEIINTAAGLGTSSQGGGFAISLAAVTIYIITFFLIGFYYLKTRDIAP